MKDVPLPLVGLAVLILFGFLIQSCFGGGVDSSRATSGNTTVTSDLVTTTTLPIETTTTTTVPVTAPPEVEQPQTFEEAAAEVFEDEIAAQDNRPPDPNLIQLAPLDGQTPLAWWPNSILFVYEGDVPTDWPRAEMLAAFTDPALSGLTPEAFAAATGIAEEIFFQSTIRPPSPSQFPTFWGTDNVGLAVDPDFEGVQILGSSATQDGEFIRGAVVWTALNTPFGPVDADVFEVLMSPDGTGGLNPIPCFEAATLADPCTGAFRGN